MLFNSIDFFVFFGVVFAVYRLLQSQLLMQNVLLLAASYLFYGWWDPRFLSLIALSTATDYICGLIVGRQEAGRREFIRIGSLLFVLSMTLLMLSVDDAALIGGLIALYFGVLTAAAWLTRAQDRDKRARLFIAISVSANLGILGVFKYFDFFAESFAEIASSFGWSPGFVTLNLVLPVGISFYTFQTMSYTIDIYRGRLKPTRELVDFAAFVSFFPQLVAGPIERASNLLPQFQRRRTLTWERAQSGAMLFLWGLAKKVVIADNLAPLADRAFANPAGVSPEMMTIGVLAFTFQIYCDFSGYSDMARGTARILGFDLILNFNLPYFSRTPSEFWRRWHISLSSWLRDYLYIALGGNRGGTLLTYRNLMLTMALGGLWHGAAWTFIAWGVLHGGVLILYRILAVDERLAASSLTGVAAAVRDGAMMLVMFLVVVVSWIFFRAETLADAWTAIGALTLPTTPSPELSQLLIFVAPLICVQILQEHWRELEFWRRLPRFASYNVVLFLLCSVVFLGAEGGQQFIYFDF